MRHLTHLSILIPTLMTATSLTGCATLQSSFDEFISGSVTWPKDMDKTVTLNRPIEADEPYLQNALYIPDGGELDASPIDIELYDRPRLSGFQAVDYAQREAVVKPQSENYLNAIQLYPYAEGSLYQIYTSPSQVTDIALEKGEGLITISAGDTERWTVGDTVSGSGPNEQVHVIVKPMAANLSTNAVITSTKRTYYLELKSFAATYMAAVSWRYPHDLIKSFNKTQSDKPRIIKASYEPAQLQLKTEDLRFDYVIKGDTPEWRPMRVFDDGQKVFIQFPKDLAVSEAPPLFVTDKKDKIGKLVNYRVKGDYYVVDRLFSAAELRLGEKDQVVVRIERMS